MLIESDANFPVYLLLGQSFRKYSLEREVSNLAPALEKCQRGFPRSQPIVTSRKDFFLVGTTREEEEDGVEGKGGITKLEMRFILGKLPRTYPAALT